MDSLKAFFHRYTDGILITLPLALATGIISLFWGHSVVNDLLDGSLYHNLSFTYPVYADLDSQKNLYVIDNKSRRIVSLSPNGNERWVAEGGQRGNGFYESYRLAAKPAGGVCAYNFILDPVDASKQAEEIVSFDDQGHYQGVLVRLENPKGEGRSDDEAIGSLQISEGFLYYFLKEKDRLSLLRRPLTVGEAGSAPATHEQVFSAPLTIDWVSAVPHLPQGVIISDRTGNIYLLTSDGTLITPAFATSAAAKPFEKPWMLKTDTSGQLYILDNFRQVVYRANSLESTNLVPVFTESSVLMKGLNRPFFESISFSADGSGTVVDKFNNSVFFLDSLGSSTVVTGATRTMAALTGYSLLLAAVLIFLPSGLLATIGLLRRIFARRTSLILKQIVLFLPLVVLSVSVGAVLTYQKLDASYQAKLRAKLALIASLGSRLVDGELVGQINSAADFHGETHQALLRQVATVLNANQEDWSKDMRIVIYKYLDDKFYFVGNTSNYYGVMFPYGGASRNHFAAARGGSLETVLYSDEYGSYLGGLAPLTGRDGRITGVFEVYHNYSTVEELAATFRLTLFWGIVISVLTVTGLLALLDIFLFISLNYMQLASSKLMEGELGIVVRSTRHDEIGDLARDFNTMSGKLSSHFNRLKQVQEANARFVPAEFINYLGKQSIAEVGNGDQIRRSMTLFFADIRSFTTISEGLTPKENFDFVNDYFGVMGPVIRANGGFIDRYIGDAIMAIFPGKPEDAVQAGMGMREALAEFNRKRTEAGKPAIDFGVGIHTENIILGVVGESSRLSVTVVADGVDLVNRLESATKKYHVSQVISAEAWKALPKDWQERFLKLDSVEYQDSQLAIYGM